MQNDPELDGKYLGTITVDFVKVAHLLKEAAYQLRSRKISAFPIFPIAKQEIAIGQLLIKPEEKGLHWFYYFSFLEEFLDRKLVSEKSLFESTYKDPEEFCCLFVLDIEQDFARFVYIPYPEEEDESLF